MFFTRGIIKNVIIYCVKSTNRYKSGFVSVNGNEIYYEKSGDCGDVILCIPGALGSCRSDFSYQLDELKTNFQVLSFDPRGYGKSGKPRVFSKDFYHKDAADASKLMEILGYKKYSVLGWSDGGTVGMILASEKQAFVQNLVIWGSNSFVSKEDVALIQKIGDIENWSLQMKAPLEAFYGKENLKELWSNWMNAYFSFSENPSGDICLAALPNIICPTLIVHGAKDPLVPAFHPTYLHKNIKKSQLFIFPEGKHNLHIKFHKEFNNLVTKFIHEHTVDLS